MNLIQSRANDVQQRISRRLRREISYYFICLGVTLPQLLSKPSAKTFTFFTVFLVLQGILIFILHRKSREIALAQPTGSTLQWIDELSERLADAGRALQPDQRRTVLAGFAGCRLPLYLKLLSEEAKLWHSYDPPPPPPADVAAVLEGMLDRLEAAANHGPLLVRRGLGFLAAARRGLADDEVIDLLSADREFFDDFRGRVHHPLPDVVDLDRLLEEMAGMLPDLVALAGNGAPER